MYRPLPLAPVGLQPPESMVTHLSMVDTPCRVTDVNEEMPERESPEELWVSMRTGPT